MKRTQMRLGLAVGAVIAVMLSMLPARGDSAPKTIAITAKRFEYSPNKVTLKKGETVTLHITSQDVTHGMFVRPLKIDTDIPPGQSVDVTVTPMQVGTFTAICHHFCGAGHGNMKMTFEVVE